MIEVTQREKDIEEVIKKYCSSRSLKAIGYDYSEYGRSYHFTNEHLIELYNQIDFTNYHTALSVLSSGDHVFNMIYNGMEQVDTFDSSRLTEYYALGIKKTAIEQLNYQEFLTLFSNSLLRNDNELALEKYVLSCTPKEYKFFWGSFLEAQRNLGEENPTIFTLCRDVGIIRGNNLYIQREKDYNKLKENLKHAEITYTNADIRDLPELFSSYDIIALSNIISVLDSYVEPGIIHNMIKSIYESNLNKYGQMIYDYKFKEDVIIDDEYFNAINYAPKLIRKLNGDEAAILRKR
ncbi:MAG: hypothetical protein IJA94_05290 [Bacilli bacterium]|nr:hypothetical protein [Bacilli bacterium]